MNVGEEKTFSSEISTNLSDYPSVLSNAGAIYYPHINIKKHSNAYGFVFVQSVIVDGTPKAVLGYYNNGSMIWGQLIN